MTDFTLMEVFGMSLKPIVDAVRRAFIAAALRDCEYTLSHIASTRANDNQVERTTQRRQAFLKAELRKLGGAQ